jgi:hypothetical protein
LTRRSGRLAPTERRPWLVGTEFVLLLSRASSLRLNRKKALLATIENDALIAELGSFPQLNRLVTTP